MLHAKLATRRHFRHFSSTVSKLDLYCVRGKIDFAPVDRPIHCVFFAKKQYTVEIHCATVTLRRGATVEFHPGHSGLTEL